MRIKAALDKSNAIARYLAATFLANAGIPVLIDAEHAIAHNKIMILDRYSSTSPRSRGEDQNRTAEVTMAENSKGMRRRQSES